MSAPSPDAVLPAAPDSAALPPPDWRALAQAGQWAKASAAAQLGALDPQLTAALSSLGALQSDVRARGYAAARRALSAYKATLSELDGAEAVVLRREAPPEELEKAIHALHIGVGEHDLEELKTKLGPAEAQALTRAEAANALGVLHALKGQPTEAKAQFDRALTFDPEHYRARMNLGNLALEAGDPVTAEAAYREVLRLAPDYDGAHHNLGVALRKQGKVYESVGSIRKAQRLGLRRHQAEGKEEIKEQLRTSPQMRLIRNGLLLLLLLILVVSLLPVLRK